MLCWQGQKTAVIIAAEKINIRFGNWAWRISPMRLAGPIFEKELRVASRQKRTYLYRTAYVLGLLAMMLPYWIEAFYLDTASSVFRQAAMAEGVVRITSQVMWFQFFALPAAAVLLLSGAFSEEISKRTLGVLMTTPVSSLKIVSGKLLSALYQIFVLMMLGIPIFAIIRVYGGLEWKYIFMSLWITLSLILLASSMTLCISTLFNKPHTVLIVTAIVLAIVYMGIPFILHCLADTYWNSHALLFIRDCYTICMPYGVFRMNGDVLLQSRVPYYMWQTAMPQYSGLLMWTGISCGISLVSTLALLLLTTKRTRKNALNQINGQNKKFFDLFNGSAQEREPAQNTAKQKPLRTVTGNAVIWKELQNPILKRRKLRHGFYCLLGIIVYGLVFLLLGILLLTGSLDTVILFAMFLGAAAILFTAIFSAEAITGEKEMRSWPILLTTPLTGKQILFGKFFGIIKRSFVFWFIFIAFWLILVYVRLASPLGVWHACILVEIYLLIYATGVFSSILFQRTTTAVLYTAVLLGVFWLSCPMYWMVMRYSWLYFPKIDDVMEMVSIFSPLMQWITLEDEYFGPSYWNHAVRFAWIGNVFISAILLFLANHFLRKRIF
jgi:ABC-type transport system involved in multi-copper enzyme maturation permease subunit